ncbi:hypothetical protein PGT21_015529 [Puccinia graminis f. sp. tritici]|uniref:Zinc/iron permease n=1 Tax=Puccinia graminis f. sp. tritici TaxID=56615 RepID=A0A5B0SHH3_PUCGR|nr:hypothetical protein PGT21_015529 [Puccinia graminis f. sp. tritici]KAA1136703.1 hypothetical protein PGTUg99_037248 [Puccinia graminis f. sp. tritici]
MAFLQLFILVTVMFISTFILGSLPLSLSTTLSPTRFHQLSIFSVGLLIGAALTIVIPEGIDTIYSSSEASSSGLRANQTDTSPQPIISHEPQLRHHHTTIGLALMGGFMLMFLIDQFTRIPTLVKKNPVEGRASRRNSSTRLSKVVCSSSTSTTTSSSQTTRLLSEEGCHEDGLVIHPGLLILRPMMNVMKTRS